MVFKKCSVGNHVFGDLPPGEQDDNPENMNSHARNAIVQHMSQANSILGNALREFFTMLAVCHTAMIDNEKGS